MGIVFILAIVVAGASALVWSYVLPSVTTTADQLDEVDLAIGSAAVSRAATSQAVVFAVSTASGTATNEDPDTGAYSVKHGVLRLRYTFDGCRRMLITGIVFCRNMGLR